MWPDDDERDSLDSNEDWIWWGLLVATVFILIGIAAVAHGQPQAPPMKEFPGWFELSQPRDPVAVFIGMEARAVRGMVSCQESRFPGVMPPAIVVSKGGLWLKTLDYKATDTEIRRAAGLEVAPKAQSFQSIRSTSDACRT